MPFYCGLTQPNKRGGRCKLGLCLQVLSQGKRKKHMFLVHFSSTSGKRIKLLIKRRARRANYSSPCALSGSYALTPLCIHAGRFLTTCHCEDCVDFQALDGKRKETCLSFFLAANKCGQSP